VKAQQSFLSGIRLSRELILLSNGNWSAPAYGGNYLKTKRNGKENTVKIQTTLNERDNLKFESYSFQKIS
jgi:hypothetical protein